MKKYLILPWLFSTFLFAQEVTVSVPQSVLQGDFIAVIFSGKTPLRDARITVLTDKGARAKTIEAVPVDTENQRFVALCGISIFWNPGTWAIEATAHTEKEVVQNKIKFTIVKKTFPKQEIALNTKNTSIVSNKSPQKKAQVKSLSQLFTTTNPKAVVSHDVFVPPVHSKRRTSAFGEARIFKMSDGTQSASYHWGVDFGVPVGTAVYAPAEGRVVFADTRITTGLTLILEHFPGVYSAYYHLSAIEVQKDAIVQGGSLMARSGNTGLSTGPHLHWELRVNGTPISPDAFLGKRLF